MCDDPMSLGNYERSPVVRGSVLYEEYDLRGNPTRIHTIETAINPTAPVLTTVEYDARSQVKRVVYPDNNGTTVFPEELAYDRAGNRTRHVGRDGIARTHVVDAAHQLDAILDEATGAVLADFGYDGAGRRKTALQGGQTTTYTYDGLGRLTRVAPETGDALDLAYDAADHRSSWSEGSEGRSYFGEWIEWHGELPAGEGRRLVHGGAIDRVIGEIDAAGLVRTYYPDAQGNVGPVAFYGPGVAPAFEASPRRYEAFGAVRAGASSVDRGFAGRPTEGSTGLVYLRARHYDPQTGRFLQSDPLGLEAQQLYAYAANNPYVFGDPLGLDRSYSQRALDQTLFAFTSLFERAIPSSAAFDELKAACSFPGCEEAVDRMRFNAVTLPSRMASAATFGIMELVLPMAGAGVGPARSALMTAHSATAVRGARGLGDLTAAEVQQIQGVVNQAGRPLAVVGSAARGTRRGIGTDQPIGKGPGTRNDIAFLVPPSSRGHFTGLEKQLPSLDPRSGIIPGTHNPYVGPAIRFEPGVDPFFVPGVSP